MNPDDTSTTSAEPALPDRTTVYMLQPAVSTAEQTGWQLAPVLRNTNTVEEALRDLFSGLTSSETDIGLFTAIPETAELRSVQTDGSTVTVDLSAAFVDSADELTQRARLAQIVYTVSTFDHSIDTVRILIDGAPAVGFEAALTRADFTDLIGGILVETPQHDSWAPPPLTITGAAVTAGRLMMEIGNANGSALLQLTDIPVDDAGRFTVTIPKADLPDTPAVLQLRVYITGADSSITHEQVLRFRYATSP